MSMFFVASLILLVIQSRVNCAEDSGVASVGHSRDNNTTTPGHGAASNREKRFIVNSQNFLWPRGIVSYEYDKDLDNSEKREIEVAMSVYEYYTPIRFVKWTTGSTAEGSILFMNSVDRCTAEIGYSAQLGQSVYCCGRRSCLHELGHSLGFIHEQSHPDRDRWIRVNWEYIDDYIISQFYRFPSSPIYMDNRYDFQSYMHYSPQKSEDLNGVVGKSYQPLFQLSLIRSHFYMFKQLCEVYAAENFPQCQGHKLTCVNDGYVSVVGGKCACICPTGLDHNTGCRTPLKKDADICVKATAAELTPGTEFNISDNIPWKWEYKVKSNKDCPPGRYIKAIMRISTTIFPVCVSTSTCAKGECKAPPGSYCYLWQSRCPKGRRMNSRYIVLIGGTFSKKRKLRFCCIENGFIEDETNFPTETGFVLFLRDNRGCQAITGMHVEKKEVVFGTVLENKVDFERFQDYIAVCEYKPVDMDCGAVIELNDINSVATIQSDNTKNSFRHCTWLVKGPDEDGTLILNIHDSDIADDQDHKCVDSLEVKHVMIGQPGVKLCGTRAQKSFHSVYDKMMLRFFTNPNSTSFFRATVTWIRASEWCYNKSDGGRAYAGNVNYTRTFKPCIHWTEATNCKHNAFDGSASSVLLEGNNCRSPDQAWYPWCYTDTNNCKREFCDVCHMESRFDVAKDCHQRGTEFCDKDMKTVVQNCAKTCEKRIRVKKVSEISCPVPGSVSGGVLMSGMKTSYGVGDKVVYRCWRDSSRVVERMCLTTGQWSVANMACTECPVGFKPFKENCFKYNGLEAYLSVAKKTCVDMGAILASPKSKEENDFIFSIRPTNIGGTWLGAEYRRTGRKLVWNDGTDLVYSNFLGSVKGAPSESNLLTLGNDKKWHYELTNRLHPFICQKPARDSDCFDYLDTCADLVKTGGVTCDKFPGLKNLCSLTCS